MKKHLLTFACIFLFAGLLNAQRTITGTVTGDSDGEPLIGASIIVSGTSVGTVTNLDGTYSLDIPRKNATLEFSYTGYKSQKKVLGMSDEINVELSTDVLILDEVVVTAYGSQKKRQITGSVVSIKSEDIEKIQNSHVVQGLTGKIAGVQIIAQNGQPGEGPTVRFRGIGSINASSAPLYVVDGVPFNGNINSIASQDIASMSFLKDASANALYGSRGANGVIIITTKKATKNGIQVTLDTRIGRNTRAVKDYDIITDPGEFYEVWFQRHRIGLMNQGMTSDTASMIAAAGLVANGEFSLGYNNYDVADEDLIDPATGKLNPNAKLLYQDKWAEELFSPSTRTETHLSISSKTDKTNSLLSFGYLDDAGYALKSGFTRVTGRGSMDFNVNNWLDVGGSINYANTEQDAPVQNVGSNTYSNLFGWARNVAPIYPVYARDEAGDLMKDQDGESIFDFGEAGDGIPGIRPYGAFNNPVATSIHDIDNNSRDNLTGRVFAKISFLNDFSFTYNLGTDYIGGNFTSFATPIGGDAKNVNGRLTSTSTKAFTITNQQFLDWNKDFDMHNVSVLVGHESNAYNFSLVSASKTEALLNDLAVLNNATNIQFADGYAKAYNVEGYFSRVNYDFDNRYFINASLRRDGSSVFSPDNRWGTFYGIGAAWDITQESFMEDVVFLSNLRLKASYGQQGNDAILYESSRTRTGDNDNRNYYAHVDQFDVINAGGGVPGVSFVTLGNKDLVWETSTNMNVGFEAAIMDNRIRLGVEVFQRNVNDLLFFSPLPLSEGRGSFPDNVGDMLNTGYELTIDADVLNSRDFSWAVGINATSFKNKITALPQPFIDLGNFRLKEGKSRYDFYMREYAGVDAETGDAMWFQDELALDEFGNPIVNEETGEFETTGDKVETSEYNEADEYYIGKSAIPDLYGGFYTDVSFKGISLTVNFAYQLGGYGYDGLYQGAMPSAPDVGHNYHRDILDSWTPENTDADIPRLDLYDTQNNNTSDYFLIDASYLSLQDVVVGYDLPTSIFGNTGIGGLQIYAAASNVYLWSARQGYDPRLSVVGSSSNEYSVVRSMSIGAKVKF